MDMVTKAHEVDGHTYQVGDYVGIQHKNGNTTFGDIELFYKRTIHAPMKVMLVGGMGVYATQLFPASREITIDLDDDDLFRPAAHQNAA